jgi:hypothetical protein
VPVAARRAAPRPAARPTPRPARDLDQAIKAPGLAAFLRRHPRLGRRGALGAIGSGVLLFVIACVTTPVAGANVAAPQSPGSADLPFRSLIAEPPAGALAPAVQEAVKRDVKHAAKPAPASHGVISGLAANGIPTVALNAYRVAAARMANVQPGCGIDWALLAGIGREESDHGRFAGAVLHADGVSTPRIIGPALDGVHWDYIPAPANGLALDGDARYAHALGPMQFIPSTWALYGTDATGDGKADIFNINDAALGAARYLCAAGGNLRTHGGQVRAVLAYNHSDQYLAQVLALADAYRRGIAISGIPVGITSGPLPTITDTGYVPPANPGAPTAADKSGTGTSGSTPKQGSGKTSGQPKPAGTTSGTKSSSSAPAPTRSTSSPAPTKSGSTTSSPSPSPTPTTSCSALDHLLGRC